MVHIRYLMQITADPSLPWKNLAISSSSAQLEEDDPVFLIKGPISPSVSQTEVCVNLVSFGERAVTRSDVLKWSTENDYRMATPREVMAIPMYNPNFYRMLGYFEHSLAPDQRKVDYMQGGICGGPSKFKTPYIEQDAQVVCPQLIQASGVDHILCIDCIDHGDFSCMSYWPQLYVFDDNTRFDGRHGNGDWPHWTRTIGCVWFAFVPLPPSALQDAEDTAQRADASPLVKNFRSRMAMRQLLL